MPLEGEHITRMFLHCLSRCPDVYVAPTSALRGSDIINQWKAPRSAWVISPDRAKFAPPHGPKFKIPLHRSCVLRPIKYNVPGSLTSAQRSRSLTVLNMLTPDGRTDGQTVDRFYKSYRDGRLNSLSLSLPTFV